MSSVAAPYGATTAMADLDAITDEERLRIMWQQAEDFGERRRIRARMYKLREQRLREMMQNDEESLGTLNVTDDGGVTECSETTITVEGGSDSTRRSSNIQVTMHLDGDSAVTESISTQNVRLGGLTMRGVDTVSLEGLQPDDIIEERIRKASDDRATRFQRIMGELSDSEANSEGEAVVSITKNTYSIQSNALAGGGYLSMKNKEVRDSVSPTRIMRERRSSAEDETSANEGRLISDDEVALKAESENVLQAMQTSTSKTSSSRKTSKEEKTSTRTTRSRQSEIPVRKESSSRRVSERKTSKELDLSSVKRTSGEKTSPTSPTKHTPGESSSRSQMPRRTGAQKEAPTSPAKSPTRTSNKGVPSSKKSKLAEIESKMETSIMSELDKLDSYLKASVSDDDDEIIMEEEEDCVDDSGNIVKMLVQTRRKKDGTECTARRVARSTKVVNTESEIDEILIGNPDHEVLERDVAEEEDKEGNKIKIITETRRRPDGITYTTKNILKTSKIFDYDHPEDVAYNEEDELISTDETEETDENGITIQTVTETRRKPNGMEYTTKKVYKTSKVKSTQITPSDDDEVIDTKETEEKKDDGSIIRTVIETRRTKTGEEYTHRQVFRSRRMTLSGVDLQKGLPIMQNDDEVINKKEKEETDDSGVTVKVVTETRRRKDGSTYSFEYVLRTFHGTEDDVKKIPVGGPGSSNIAVSADDELINEDVKEDVKEDGSTVKTIIERRRAKDGTEYLRHRIMRIPKMPEPVLQVANLDDEVLQEEVKEKTLNDGTHYKAVTERRRSSVSGLQYTLRRMSKTYQQPTHHPRSSEDEILDENVTEEETDDGTVVKTVIQRYQRPDGSVYTTHNIHRTFSSPAPVTFVGTEDDELVDQSVDEKETEDGYIIKTVIERRRRSDGVQYTVERTEKTSKFGPQVHITYSGNESPRKPDDFVQLGSPDDMVVSCEENEYEEEDGTIVRSVVEIRRRVDGTEYTTKTVIRSTPVLVPERETSYVVIKHEGGNEDEEVGFFPSLDDEVVYTRRREEIGDDGEPISVIIETRQSKTSGEKYNITKRVHTKDVVLTEEGEKEIPKTIMKSTLVANIAPSTTTKRENKKPSTTTEEPEDDQDDVPYGSVSALKNRFVPASSKKTESADKPSKPDRLNTLNKKKFFEDAAKTAGGSSPIPKSTPRKLEPKDRPREPDKDAAKRDLLPAFSDDKASIEVKLRIEKDQATVEDVETHKLTYQTKKDLQEEPDTSVETKDVDIKDLDTEIAKLEEEEKWRYKQDQLEPEDLEEPEEEISPDEVEPEEEVYSPSEEEPAEPLQKPAPSKKSPTASRKTIEKPRKIEEPRKKRETSPRKKPEADEPLRRVPATSRKVPSKEDSPTRRVPASREPITPKESTKRVPKSNTSPQRVPSSPHRGRSPNRSGVSTPRDVTPTGRNCCKTHREANEREPVSPTRTQKKPRSTVPSAKKTTSPEGKPRMNGDVRRIPTEPRMNGDINKRPEDRTPRTRRPVEKSSEPERSGVRPTKLSQTPRKSPTARSPDKREPTKSLPSRTSDRKSPTKSSERTPKGRSPDSEQREKPKSTLSVPESRDPVVTLPETPMREDMKRLPVDDELGPEIEDVSCEPDLPYHTIHRPSIVREPSEHPAIDSQEEASDSAPEEQPEHYEEPSDTELEDKKTVKSSRKPQQEPSPTRDDVSKPRKMKPLESRPSDKSLPLKDSEVPRKKQPETRKPRDRPWLIEKRNSFERKPSEPKPSTVKPDEDKKVERRKPFERKPSEEIVKKPKGGKPSEILPDEEIYSSSDSEGKENGITEEITKEVILPTQEAPEDDKQPPRKTEEKEIFKKRTDFEKSVASQIITEKNEKNITTSDVAARRSVFNVKVAQPDTKKDIKPTRKPSYEIKESVFSKRSLFEQPKQEHIPSPIRKPLLKSSVKKDDKPKQPEERKPVKEPVIVPKYFHPLGESDGDEPVEKTIPEPVEEEVRMTSSKLVMNAMATTSQTSTTEVRRESTKQEPLKKERSPSPYSRERSSLPHSKEGTPVPRSKESSPAPFAKEGSPTRFITGKPIDSGINTNKIRRIERTGSNKKLLEDLEVSRDSLPQYLSSIETIFDVTILENMLEKAETYEERRIIRGQLRIAKRPGSRTTTPSNTVPSKKFTPISSQPRRPDDQRATKPQDSEEPSLSDTTRKPLSKLGEPDTLPVSQQPEEDQPAYTTSPATSPSSIRRPRKTSRDYFEPAEEPTEPAEEPRSPRKYTEDEPEKYEPEEPKKSERQIKPEEPRRFGRNIQPEEPRRFGQNVQPEEPRKFGRSVQPEEPRRFGQSVQPEEPRKFGRNVQPEEPRRFGRNVQPEEPRKAEPSPKVAEPSKPVKTQTQPIKTAPSDEPYSEPLRYQKGQSRTPSKPTTEQSDVDKIVSAYGVGPTDENGLPLFGLRALKRRSPPTTCVSTPRDEQTEPASQEPRRQEEPQPHSEPEEEEEPKTEEYEPKDSSGRPLFGLRALRKPQPITTSTTTTESERTTSVTERRETASSVMESSRLVSSVVSQRPTHTTEVDSTESPRDSASPEPEDLDSESEDETESLERYSDEEETSPGLVRNLRDSLRKKEPRSTRPAPYKDAPSGQSPDTLSRSPEDEVITRRSQPLKEILKLHESKDRTKEMTIKDQLNSTDDILDTLTEDQITRLSEEFDLRAQDDGVIKTEESVEELSGGYRVTSRTEAEHPDGSKFVRKTSYTEIKLQQPSKEDGSRVVSSSSSATVEQSSGATFHVSRGTNESGEDDTMREGRSFLDDRSKVTGITDVLSRMGATEAVDHEGKVTSDDQARSLLNRFLGAQVLMSGVESMMASSSLSDSSRVVTEGESRSGVTQEASSDTSVTHLDASYSTAPLTTTTTTTSTSKGQAEHVVVRGVNISEVTDDHRLNQLLDSCDEYEDRRRIRMRLKTLMAEKKALREELSGHDLGQGLRTQANSAHSKFEAVSKSTTSSSKESNLRSSEGENKASTVSPFGVSRTSATETRDSSQAVQKSSYSSSFSTSSTSNSSSFITKTDSKKVVSPFDKFKQLDAQTSPRPARE